MKSQYYREVQVNNFTRQSTNQHTLRCNKQQIVHPSIVSRTFKSERRCVKNSVDIIKKSKPETQNRCWQGYQSKSGQIAQNQANIEYIRMQADACGECEWLRQQKQRSLKLLQMQKQQQLTDQKQRYIQMQKKYLLKQSQLIDLTQKYDQLLQLCQHLQEKNITFQKQVLQARQTSQNLQLRINGTEYQSQNYNSNLSRLKDILQKYLQQTKLVLGWVNKLQKNQERLAPNIFMIKQDIVSRKDGLETSYQQALTLKKQLISYIQMDSQDLLNQSEFIQQPDIVEGDRFMKYLKQESGRFRSTDANRCSEIKNYSHCFDTFTANKQNSDYFNRNTLTALQKSVNAPKIKLVTQNSQEEYFRLLLLQAKTIQASRQISYNQKSDYHDFKPKQNAEHLSHSII